jgi:hypothetical protein
VPRNLALTNPPFSGTALCSLFGSVIQPFGPSLEILMHYNSCSSNQHMTLAPAIKPFQAFQQTFPSSTSPGDVLEVALVQSLPRKQEQPVLQFYQQPSSYQTSLSSLCQSLDASPHDYLQKLSSASGVIIKSKRALIYIDLSTM